VRVPRGPGVSWAGRTLLAAAAGALLVCAFAPWSVWPLAILCPAVLMGLWQGARAREAALLGFAFNLGTFAFGTWWLFIGLHEHGGAPVWLALGLMGALTCIMALYHALLGYCVARWLPGRGAVRWLLALPGAWVLIEWWRGWFLSGFSWLSLGYSQTDSWLGSLAPVGGVYAISAVLLMSAGALVTLVHGTRRERFLAAAALAVPWLAALALSGVQWTQPAGPAVSVALLQGAVPQDVKWEESHREETLRLYRDLIGQALGTRLIVMPEAALPDVVSELSGYLTERRREAQARGSALVLGVLRDNDADEYFNSVLALDATVSWYDKHHLVPFAEVFPVPAFIRSWMRLINLPYGDFTAGGARQPPLPVAGLRLAASICYEDAYGSTMIPALARADAGVNVTNDAWFGRSGARFQHLQIARMRALEAGRFLVRVANDGISAVIGPHGEILAQAPPYRPAVLRASLVPYRGLTPYAHVGNWVIVTAALAALACGLRVR
jgi:apolipoprotein N-acyltransferase